MNKTMSRHGPPPRNSRKLFKRVLGLGQKFTLEWIVTDEVTKDQEKKDGNRIEHLLYFGHGVQKFSFRVDHFQKRIPHPGETFQNPWSSISHPIRWTAIFRIWFMGHHEGCIGHIDDPRSGVGGFFIEEIVNSFSEG